MDEADLLGQKPRQRVELEATVAVTVEEAQRRLSDEFPEVLRVVDAVPGD